MLDLTIFLLNVHPDSLFFYSYDVHLEIKVTLEF